MNRAALVTFVTLLGSGASCGGGSGGSGPGADAAEPGGGGGGGGRPAGGAGGAGGGGPAGAGGGAGGATAGAGGGGAGGGAAGAGGARPADAGAGAGGAAADAGAARDLGARDVPAANVMSTCTAMVQAANAFLGALTPQQRTTASRPFNDMRTSWAFVPPNQTNTQGLNVDVSPAARQAADAFLKTGLSDPGFMKAGLIQRLEAVTQRGPYSIAIYGMPSPTEAWGWRFQGHHLSLHFTVVRCAMIANTPAFWGANPASGTMGVAAPLRAEEDGGRALFMALTAEQRMAATIPRPNMTTPTTARVTPLSPAGLLASQMMPAQVDLLRKLVGEYVGSMAPQLAAARLAEIMDAGFEKIGFAWSGSATAGQGHYYRVQGPTFLIEYDNLTTAPAGNHIHSVWRDFNGDFGADVLRMHYEMYPHPAALPDPGPEASKRTPR